MASAEVRPAPEVLTLGPSPGRRRPWLLLVLLLVVALLASAGSVAWWLRTRPSDEFSLADLQDVYAGMVRADGTNDAAVMSPDQPRPPPVAVSPDACLPLVQTTLAEQFPPDALDGVSTYWLGEGASSAVSLFTVRYPDTETATSRYSAIADALPACDGKQVSVGPNTGVVAATPLTIENGVDTQLGYLVTLSTGDRYAILVLRWENTITWQFRLEFGSQPYEPYVAQRLMDSFVAQVRSIEELRRR